MEKSKVLAVQLPAPCPLKCVWCRTPEHGVGNIEKVRAAIFLNLPGIQEVYLTSNGETGFAEGFADLVDQLSKQVGVSVLCATPHSIVPGLMRAEVSYNEYTKYSAAAAIRKARELQIPVAASVVDDGSTLLNDLTGFARLIGVDAVLVRALQAEGLSTITKGQTRVWQKNIELGAFPIAAYPEVAGLGADGIEVICINHDGQVVSFLGGAVVTA